jgi:hypothetical protein
LEEFERSEAADVAPVQAPTTSAGVKLTLKPAVLGAPGSAAATPSSTKTTTQPTTVPAAQLAIKTPTKAATEALEDEPVTMDLTDSPLSSSSVKWCDDEVPEVTDACDVEVWPERRRYGETIEAEAIYGIIASVEVPVLDSDGLSVGDLQGAMREVVAQVNVAHKALATAGYVTAERSREALQQSKISSDLATEALLKTYETAAVALLSACQSWKMCIQLSGSHMPARTKDAERKPETLGRFLASKFFVVKLKPEEVAIAHFRGAQSNHFIIKFINTGTGTSHEALLYASRAMGQNRKIQVNAKIAQVDVDQELYFQPLHGEGRRGRKLLHGA